MGTHQKEEEYTIGSKISKTRILSTNKWLMDNYIEGSIDTNILSASIFSYNDIQPGQIYTCIINKIIINTSINDFKLILSILGMPKISQKRCIIPSTQFYDKGYVSNYKLS